MDFFPHRDISAPSETIPRVGASQQVFMDVCSMVHVPCSSQTTWTLIFHVYMFHVSIILRFPYFICIVAAPAHSSCCALDPKLFDGFSWWTSNIQCWPFARSPFFNNELVGGWPTPLKNDGVKVSWDDDMTPIIIWKVIIQPCLWNWDLDVHLQTSGAVFNPQIPSAIKTWQAKESGFQPLMSWFTNTSP